MSNSTRAAYCKFMQDYESLGHMRKLVNPSFDANSYYIPHHIVHKETSTSRFNASFEDDSGLSLNDCLLSGPVLQPELFDIVINFCRYLIAICCDIAQMYRQILILLAHCKYQRIIAAF